MNSSESCYVRFERTFEHAGLEADGQSDLYICFTPNKLLLIDFESELVCMQIEIQDDE